MTLPGGAALPLAWEETVLRHYTTCVAVRERVEAEAMGERLLSNYLLSQIDGTVTSTRVDSAVQGGWLLVTLSAECREQIGASVPILLD